MKVIYNISTSNVVIGGQFTIVPNGTLEISEEFITPEIAISIKANLDMHLIRVKDKIESTITSFKQPEVVEEPTVEEQSVEENIIEESTVEEVVEEKPEITEQPKKTTRRTSTKKKTTK